MRIKFYIIILTLFTSLSYAFAQETSKDPAIHYVGEIFDGGIVFFVTLDGQHGLMASLNDLDNGKGVEWGLDKVKIDDCKSMTDGYKNTIAIMKSNPKPGTAAVLCHEYTGGGKTDWYLPSNRELYLLCSHDILFDKILDNDGDPNTNGFLQESIPQIRGRYWSSSIVDKSFVWTYNFLIGYSDAHSKNMLCKVRAIRKF